MYSRFIPITTGSTQGKSGKTKIMKIKAVEFINRFMMHVLPWAFINTVLWDFCQYTL
jgi:hypothetical protein